MWYDLICIIATILDGENSYFSIHLYPGSMIVQFSIDCAVYITPNHTPHTTATIYRVPIITSITYILLYFYPHPKKRHAQTRSNYA
jgi:hypothetical protein